MDDIEARLQVDSYTNESGYFVFTERAHLNRGKCCGSGCRHCPFEPRARAGTTRVRAEIADLLAPIS